MGGRLKGWVEGTAEQGNGSRCDPGGLEFGSALGLPEKIIVRDVRWVASRLSVPGFDDGRVGHDAGGVVGQRRQRDPDASKKTTVLAPILHVSLEPDPRPFGKEARDEPARIRSGIRVPRFVRVNALRASIPMGLTLARLPSSKRASIVSPSTTQVTTASSTLLVSYHRSAQEDVRTPMSATAAKSRGSGRDLLTAPFLSLEQISTYRRFCRNEKDRKEERALLSRL